MSSIAGTKQHAIALDTSHIAGLEVAEDHHLPVPHLFQRNKLQAKAGTTSKHTTGPFSAAEFNCTAATALCSLYSHFCPSPPSPAHLHQPRDNGPELSLTNINLLNKKAVCIWVLLDSPDLTHPAGHEAQQHHQVRHVDAGRAVCAQQ